MKFLRTLLAALVVAGASLTSSWGFSLLGPLKNWQVQGLGYNGPFEVGGPMFAHEAYRWNVPTIYYAYDRSFIEYFGVEGIAAVESAIKHFNDLPPFNSMSADLSEFPLSTKQLNYEAEALQLTDLKSQVMNLLLEQLGLANPEQNVWRLRGRVVPNPTTTNYSVIKLNYDPVTFQPSSYVNGALYTYEITEFDAGGLVVVADEIKVGDLRTLPFSSVAGGIGAGWENQYVQDPSSGIVFASGELFDGEFYNGLTRDDVGGLRYLYSPNRQQVEYLHPDVVLRGDGSSGGGPWSVPGGGTGTNAFLTGTNLAIGLRPGVNKITFQQVQFDSLLTGNFRSFESSYTDTIITNFETRTRTLSRVVSRPDIIFSAGDLGVSANGFPFFIQRTGATGWQNNSAINTAAGNLGELFGPGVIAGPVTITFTSVYPAFSNGTPGRTGEGDGFSATWASFDGSTGAPVIYPKFGTVNTDILRSFNLGNNDSSPWTAVTVSIVTTNATATTTTQ